MPASEEDPAYIDCHVSAGNPVPMLSAQPIITIPLSVVMQHVQPLQQLDVLLTQH